MWKSILLHNGAECRTKKSRELNQRRSVWRCLAMFVALDSACQPLHLQFFPDSVQLIFNILTSSEFAITASRQYWWHIRWHRPCCNVWCWIAIDCERLFHILVGCCNFSSRQFLGTPLLRFAPVDSQHLAPGIDKFKTKKNDVQIGRMRHETQENEFENQHDELRQKHKNHQNCLRLTTHCFTTKPSLHQLAEWQRASVMVFDYFWLG